MSDTEARSEFPDTHGEYYRLVVQLAHTQILFLKRQQWLITHYGVLLYGVASVFLSRAGGPSYFPPILACGTWLGTTFLVWGLHCDISKARARARTASKFFPKSYREAFPEDVAVRGFAGLGISILLTVVLLVGLVVVLLLMKDWSWLPSASLTTWLNAWQTLVGAVLGGAFALLVAVVVAYDARARQRRSNAYYLITQLRSVEIWKESIWTIEKQTNQVLANLTKLARKRTQEADSGFRLEQTLKILRIRPRLSPLFEQAMSGVMEIDPILSAHLGIFWQAALAAEKLLAHKEEELVKLLGWFTREAAAGNSPSVAMDFGQYQVEQLEQAVLHAKKSVDLLNRLILKRGALWRRLLRSIYIPKTEEEYLKGLQREERQQTKASGAKSL